MTGGIGRLRDADSAPWHRAAAAWAALTDELERMQGHLADAGHDLEAAWPEGAGAEQARLALRRIQQRAAHAAPPVRRIATALHQHAYELAALRDLEHLALSEPERRALLDRRRELDARTSDALLASCPVTAPRTGTGLGVRRRPPPERVAAWWRGLAPDERERLRRDQPEAIGGLDGVFAVDRDRANRAVLATAITRLSAAEADLAHRCDPFGLGRASPLAPQWLGQAALPLELALAQVRSRLAELEAVRSALRAFPEALLLGIDVAAHGSGEPRVIVALGDPDHARHTAVFVPGAGTDLADTAGGLARASALRAAAEELTPRSGEGDVAVVYWLGYDAPDGAQALLYGPSTDGARRLTPFLAGLQAAHDAPPAHVTLVGHSYGTAVVAEAALRGGLRVDDIVAVGSPGMHAPHASALGLDPRHVWGGVAGDDLIGGALGELSFVHGQEPTDPAFGANRFVVDTRGHGGYWEPGSRSLHNQAAIVAGRYDLVQLVHGGAP